MSKVTFAKDGQGWVRQSELTGLNSFDMVKLRVALMDCVGDLDAIIDAESAEGQLEAEVGRRMRNLSSRAQAAGMMSDMWSNTNHRFYKERLVIERMLSEPQVAQ